MMYGFKGTRRTALSYLLDEAGNSRLLRAQDVAELLGIARNTVDIWKMGGVLPPADLAFLSDSGRSTGDMWLVDTIMAHIKDSKPTQYAYAVEFLGKRADLSG